MNKVGQLAKLGAKAVLPAKVRQALRNAKRALTGSPSLSRLVARFCEGRGIEVGPGKNPYCSANNTVFLDKHTDNKCGMPNPDFVADANRIPASDGRFDFLLSSHYLEHAQNTIKTLNEWTRVLRAGGTLFLILPHGDRTLDRHRAKTALQHHIDDFTTLTDRPDRSHIEEITAGWSANEDAEAAGIAYEREWGAHRWDWDFRFENDVIHFHVWTQDEIVRLLQYLNFKIIFVDEFVPERTDSFVVVARKRRYNAD